MSHIEAPNLKTFNIDIDVNDNLQINNGDVITMSISKNFSDITYTNGERKIEKEFVSPVFTSTGKVSSFTKNNIEQNIGTVNFKIEAIEIFQYEGETKIAIGGDFLNYTKDGLNINVNKFLILNDDGTPFKVPSLLTTSGRVNAIKYHPINRTLIIGGDFNTTNNIGSNFLEYNIDTNNVNSSQSNFSNQGGIDGEILDLDIDPLNGDIYMGGTFNTLYNRDVRSLCMLDKNLDFGFGVKDIFNFNIGINIAGEIRSVKVRPFFSGSIIHVGGDFTYSNPEGKTIGSAGDYFNYCSFDSKGRVKGSGKKLPIRVSKPVYKLAMDEYYSVFIATSPGCTILSEKTLKPRSIWKLSDNGDIRSYYLESIADKDVYNIQVFNNKLLTITIDEQVRLDRFLATDGSEKYLGGLELNAGVNAIEFLENETYILGGGFNQYRTEVITTSDNQILIGQTEEETALNLYNNLVEFNTELGSNSLRYFINGRKVILQYILEDNDIIYGKNIRDLAFNYVDIYVSRNDGLILNNIDFLSLRRDVILESKINLLESNETKFRFLEVNTINTVINENDFTEIIKPRISLEEKNDYLNISTLVEKDTLSDIDYFLNNILFVSQPQVNEANVGKFLRTEINKQNNGVVISKEKKTFYVLNAYNQGKVYVSSRLLTQLENTNLVIPFSTFDIQEIILRKYSLGPDIELTGFNLEDPFTPDAFTSYVSIPDLGEDYQIIFKDNENVDTIIKVKRLVKQNLYKSNCVIFENSFGAFQNIYFSGASKRSIRTTGDSYTKSSYNNDFKNHLKVNYNKKSEREYECNTLSYSGMNMVFEDLIESENIWLYIDGETIPVNLKDTSFTGELDFSSEIAEYSFGFEEAKNKQDIKSNLKDNDTEIDISILEASITPELNLYPNSDNTLTINIESNRNWTIDVNKPWVNLSKTSGFGDDTITVNVDKNYNRFQRIANISIINNNNPNINFKIIQEAIDFIDIEPEVKEVNSLQQSYLIEVDSNATWAVNTNATWANVSKVDENTALVNVDQNGGSTRQTSINFTPSSFGTTSILTQREVEDPYLEVERTWLTTNKLARTIGYDVDSNISWTVSTPESWITLNKIDDTKFEVILEENTSGVGRIGSIIIDHPNTPEVETRIFQKRNI